jgi:hypothetical protein
MTIQNIYTISDRTYCPEGSGEPIRQYLQEAFGRIAPQVVAVGVPVDWLVIKSDSLDSVVNGSQSFFDKMFEDALQSAAGSKQKVSVVRHHGITCGGAISEADILEWIKKRLGKDFEPNYLNEPNLGLNFVGYHLNMRQ